MKVIVVGASGFIGQPLVTALLARGEEVVVTGRSAKRLKAAFGDGVTALEWDPASGPLPADADAVINLAGEPVASGRWTKAKKARIRESRILATRNVVEGMKASGGRAAVLVNASAIGFYGDRAHQIVEEGSTPGNDFLAEVCQAWESEAAGARGAGIRTAIVRMGIVLGKSGGAYPTMSRPFRLFVGGPIGLGRAFMSWIHIDDCVGILLHCLDDSNATGIYNATSPAPVPNSEFTRTLAKVLRRPALFAVPPIALRISLGGFAEIVTASVRVRPLRTLGLGYVFKHPTLKGALESIEGTG